ncbi:porin [Persephonella sp.]
MNKKLISGLVSLSFATLAFGENLEEKIKQLEQQQQQLIDEIAHLREEITIPELRSQTFSGMGYAASKVYFSPQGLSIGGYGEIIYMNYQSGSKKDKADIYRFIPYIGYKFTDSIILNAEIEFEHGANTERGGEVTVEFLYLDFLFNEWANLRLGNFLIPVGITNLLHEPIFFNSVNRPEVETKIIPSTWNENGVMLFSNKEDWNYYLAVVNGFHATKKGEIGFSSDTWVRNGRQGGANAVAEDFAVVGRIDYTALEGLFVGASVYHGNSGQGESYNGNKIDGTVTMYDLHAKYQYKGFELTGLYVAGSLKDADRISLYNGEVIGKNVYGYYLNVAYDVAKLMNKDYNLPVFVRYERYNTQDKVPSGFTADPNNDKTVWTVGINYRPIPNVVLKADYQFRDNEGNGESDIFELGLGFIF